MSNSVENNTKHEVGAFRRIKAIGYIFAHLAGFGIQAYINTLTIYEVSTWSPYKEPILLRAVGLFAARVVLHAMTSTTIESSGILEVQPFKFINKYVGKHMNYMPVNVLAKQVKKKYDLLLSRIVQ